MSEPRLDEIEVICASCSFPTVTDYDENGKVIGFREEEAPKTEEEALAEGWLDHGLGLFCPKCSLGLLEDLARDRAEGVETGASNDISEIIDRQWLRAKCPNASNDTVEQFVRMYRSLRLSQFRVLAGLEPLPMYTPVPETDEQAVEFLEVGRALGVVDVATIKQFGRKA